ncbi:MAG: serine hydrolase, partial [Cyanobacteria bacterium J06554_3]
IGWASGRGYRSRAFSRHFDQQKAAGNRMIDIEVDEVDGRARYAAVWQANTDQRGWVAYRDLTHEGFSQKWNEYKDRGFRLIDQESYTRGGQRYYAGVWVENVENLRWASYRNVSGTAFSEKFGEYSSAGYRLIDVEAYPTGNGTKYAAVWVQNNEGLGWYTHRGLTSRQFSEKFDDYARRGFRLIDTESYRLNNQQRFAGIWVKNTSGRGWFANRGMSANGFGNKWKAYKDQGYRLIDFEAYPTANGTRYAGIWRQNNNRQNWAAKSDVDEAIKSYREQFNIAGVSVAIMHKGELVYSRGFGHADIEQKKAAHAGTVYRLASVSKPITAALTGRLVDQGLLDWNDSTRSYVPGLPTFHTHTVEQLMKHRSGIRHYAGTDYQDKCNLSINPPSSWQDSSGTQYTTTTAATSIFSNDALLFTPNAQGCYSTHAYTVLGAALEGASNRSYAQLLDQELTQGLGLSTLRVENRAQGNANRATLYQTKSNVNQASTAATPDNVSWKQPGGGLEASSVDVARFGQAILDDAFLSPESRATALNNANYGHSGAQLGARSHLWFSENRDLVIAVLTNERVKAAGAAPSGLVTTIEELIN